MDITREPGQQWIEALSVGYIASNVLNEERSAKVVGVTSRGMFLRSSSRWTVFISGEPYRSPLTVTVRDDGGSLRDVRIGDIVDFGGNELIIVGADLAIRCGSEVIWRPQFPPHPASTKVERLNRLALFVQEVMERKMGAGLNPILSMFMDWRDHKGSSPEASELLHAGIINAQVVLTAKEVNSLFEGLHNLLGMGQGLTPSGDDYIVGLLLSLNRWKDTLWPEDGLSDLNERLVTSAFDRTTTLSANLIECATCGQSDERLINAVDYLMCGGADEVERVVGDLLYWGNSSGVAAFCGIGTALKNL
jgi:hypothetical protein